MPALCSFKLPDADEPSRYQARLAYVMEVEKTGVTPPAKKRGKQQTEDAMGGEDDE